MFIVYNLQSVDWVFAEHFFFNFVNMMVVEVTFPLLKVYFHYKFVAEFFYSYIFK